MVERDIVSELLKKGPHNLPLNLGSLADLKCAVDDGMVSMDVLHGLALFNYTQKAARCDYKSKAVLVSRGLILDLNAIATGDLGNSVAALPMIYLASPDYLAQAKSPLTDVSVKLDGALGIMYRLGSQIRWATRSRFQSKAALAAQQLWDSKYAGVRVPDNLTLLCEIIHPVTRVLIAHPFTDLVLIAVRDRYSGRDLPYEEVCAVGESLGMPVVERVMLSMEQALQNVRSFSTQQEGYVFRFQNGVRVKLSNDIYNGVYDLLGACSPWTVSEIWTDWLDPYVLLAYIPMSYREDIERIFRSLDQALGGQGGSGDVRMEVANRFRSQFSDPHRLLFRALPDDV